MRAGRDQGEDEFPHSLNSHQTYPPTRLPHVGFFLGRKRGAGWEGLTVKEDKPVSQTAASIAGHDRAGPEVTRDLKTCFLCLPSCLNFLGLNVSRFQSVIFLFMARCHLSPLRGPLLLCLFILFTSQSHSFPLIGKRSNLFNVYLFSKMVLLCGVYGSMDGWVGRWKDGCVYLGDSPR